VLTVVFYPALVVDEHDLESGVAGVGKALALALRRDMTVPLADFCPYPVRGPEPPPA
jgi:hypothetical protein